MNVYRALVEWTKENFQVLKRKMRLSATLSTTNPKLSGLKSNTEQRGEKPVTKCPCDDMALKADGRFPHFGYLR
jgi:hypothetical protein